MNRICQTKRSRLQDLKKQMPRLKKFKKKFGKKVISGLEKVTMLFPRLGGFTTEGKQYEDLDFGTCELTNHVAFLPLGLNLFVCVCVCVFTFIF